jgi:hypothetical protein
MILNEKKKPILVADAYHHRSRITCLGFHGVGRIPTLGGRKDPGHGLASSLDSRMRFRRRLLDRISDAEPEQG